jgi:5,10-methylene-tetrahydrofolate dehydrogenase/methenyl tetrahydrofolate cyclohydrolase
MHASSGALLVRSVGVIELIFMQGEDATVTVVHSRTPDAQAICAEADILVAAIGRAEMVRGNWIKPGAAVIDVGTNPVPVSSSPISSLPEVLLSVFCSLQVSSTQKSCGECLACMLSLRE